MLVTLQQSIENEPNRDIVINLEKCHWFDLSPLAQLLSVLCTASEHFNGALHVLGPCTDILFFMSEWVARQGAIARDSRNSLQQREKSSRQYVRHSKELPRRRKLAGAFLIGWGAIDVIEDHFTKLFWYFNRGLPVSRLSLNHHYAFAYGADPETRAAISDRVWPFTAVRRDRYTDVLRRLNGEDLIAGPLRRFAGLDPIANGTAMNVLLFEPFDNVFEHAFEDGRPQDPAVIALRVNERIYRRNSPGTSGDIRIAEYSGWEFEFRRTLVNKAVLEVTIADCGAGIPITLSRALSMDTAYLRGRPRATTSTGNEHAWEVIRYAFEPHSTRRTSVLPGQRGLAWLKEVIGEAHGAVEICSNGCCYVLADFGAGLQELDYGQSNGAESPPTSGEWRGTLVRLLIPISGAMQSTVNRGPKWPEERGSLDLIPPEIAPIFGVALPDELVGLPQAKDWNEFLEAIRLRLVRLPGNEKALIALDLADHDVTRASLEHFGETFAQARELHGRLILINCSRHVTARLATVSAFAAFRQVNLTIPAFQTGLRLYWVGASSVEEQALLDLYQHKGVNSPNSDLSLVADGSPQFFVRESGTVVGLRFTVVEIEGIVRKMLGRELEVSIRGRNALHLGRYRMPLSDFTSTAFIEPHQVMSDTIIASKLCDHLALLLRHKFDRIGARSEQNLRVLTATRIGRDIGARMATAYSVSRFIYFDYHLVQPFDPRLLSHLTQSRVVIVVDIVTTGSQVEYLLRACEIAGAKVLGIVSFVDFSPGDAKGAREFVDSRGNRVEHLTMWRFPQVLSTPAPGDTKVDPETLSIQSTEAVPVETSSDLAAALTGQKALRYLDDANALHMGHFAVFGHHFDAIANLGHVLLGSTPEREQMLYACETAILESSTPYPCAIVVYPDLSGAHMLQTSLEQRHRISMRVMSSSLRFVEARRVIGARNNRYWLAPNEIASLIEWAKKAHPRGYGVIVLDDGASSGDTLIALQYLAEMLRPNSVSSYVITNRMSVLRTRHHIAHQRVGGAGGAFASFLHLDMPVYRRVDCPLCRHRDELLRERQHAKQRWYAAEIDRRIATLEPSTTLHPQDLPDGPLGAREKNTPLLSWEASNDISGPSQTVGARALAARIALAAGYPLRNALEEVWKTGSKVLWRTVLLDIARRPALLQARGAESELTEILIKVLEGQSTDRRASALDALYLMRPEALLTTSTTKIVQASLKYLDSDELLASLVLLLRRLLSHRHLQPFSAFSEEQVVVKEIDEASAQASPGSPRRDTLERLSEELRGLTHQGLDLPTIIREMEAIFRTTRSERHGLLIELDEYIGDLPSPVSPRLLGVLDNAVTGTRLAMLFARALADCQRLQNEQLMAASLEAYEYARTISRRVRAHMHGTEKVRSVDLRDTLDLLSERCSVIYGDLAGHITNGSEAISAEWQQFRTALPSELSGVDVEVELDVGQKDYVICSQGLFRQIVRNALTNLRHAVDSKQSAVRASLAFQPTDSERIVSLAVKCHSGDGFQEKIGYGSTIRLLERELEVYGGVLILPNPNAEELQSGWRETWNFRRL